MKNTKKKTPPNKTKKKSAKAHAPADPLTMTDPLAMVEHIRQLPLPARRRAVAQLWRAVAPTPDSPVAGDGRSIATFDRALAAYGTSVEETFYRYFGLTPTR